jgi:Icc-related predicted phosphoesterase
MGRMPGVPALHALALSDEPSHIPVPSLLEQHRPVVVLTLGDLDHHDLAPLTDFAGPKLGVHGNHDAGDEFDVPGIEDLHLRRVEVDGLVFGGFGGSHRTPRGDPFTFSQEEAEALLSELGPVDVLLTHSPPIGVNDDPDDPVHIGLRALRAYVERHSPALLLHGHTYPTLAVTRLGSTRIRYVRGHALVPLPCT